MIIWNWTKIEHDTYRIYLRLYKRHFILSTTWSSISLAWQHFLCETDKVYTVTYDIDRWQVVNTLAFSKEDIVANQQTVFKTAVEMIMDTYEDESTRLIEDVKHLY